MNLYAGNHGDYQKYMKQSGGQGGGANASSGYQKYVDQYGGGYQKYMKQGGGQGGSASANSSYQKYVDRYAKEYARQSPGAPAHARDCHTVRDLTRWLKARKSQLHAYT